MKSLHTFMNKDAVIWDYIEKIRIESDWISMRDYSDERSFGSAR